MGAFVDLHCHLLPGIDDGPEDLEASIEMARAALAAGTAQIVATPHLRPDFPRVRVEEISTRCEQLSAALSAAEVELQIIPGAETSLVWALEAADEQLTAATYGQRGRDLLIETPDDVTMLDEMLYRIRVRGIRVTLAHPERSRSFQREPRRVERLVEQGVLLQVNSDALMAKPSSGTRELATLLCREGLAHALASDGHRAVAWRPVSSLAAGVEAATKLVGAGRANWLATAAPAAIIAGDELPEPPAIETARRSFWRGRRR